METWELPKSTSMPFQDLWHHTHIYIPLFSSKAHSSIDLSFYQDFHFHKSLEKQASSLYSVKTLTSKNSISRDSSRTHLQLKKYPFKESIFFFSCSPPSSVQDIPLEHPHSFRGDEGVVYNHWNFHKAKGTNNSPFPSLSSFRLDQAGDVWMSVWSLIIEVPYLLLVRNLVGISMVRVRFLYNE